MDLDKIKAIMRFPIPKNVLDVRHFMGLDGYYRRFIEGFFKASCPITSLQNKDTRFLWTHKCEEGFQNIKHPLTTAPILKIENTYGDFIVCIDVCKEGLGGVLLQGGHVICYESRKLK